MCNMNSGDIIIIGAGAAGLTAAGVALKHGKRVLVLEMGDTLARKVMASGGGRCNITNAAVATDKYHGANPYFVRSAITKVPYTDILNWAYEHNIDLYEKTPGRYFCTNGAKSVVNAMMSDARDAKIYTNQNVQHVDKIDNTFYVKTQDATYTAPAVIVATGGTSFATLGVSDVGWKIAKHFGHKIIPVRPALGAMNIKNAPAELAGIALPVQISVGRNKINDDMLFTHHGIGGPAAYRASVFDIDDGISIDLMPNKNAMEILKNAKQQSGRKNVANVLGEYMPMRVAKWISGDDARNIADIKDSEIAIIADQIHKWRICADDIKMHGMAAAEVVRGGVCVDEISSKTMESKLCDGLFFAGEVMDVAGDLGGFNLHWAWASGRVAGMNA